MQTLSKVAFAHPKAATNKKANLSGPHFYLWTRLTPIRTVAEIDLEFPIFTQELFLYQKISPKVGELHNLGMNCHQIGKALGVDEKTVKKAIRYTLYK